MGVSIIILIVAIIVVAIWLIFGFKRLKHKFLALFLISLVLFGYLSFMAVFKGKDIQIQSADDVSNVVKLYFSWLGSVMGNIKLITTQAIKMDWESNETT